MAYEKGALEATFTAAAGNDPALLVELRAAFSESLGMQLDLLRRARCDGNWNMAAMRLQGLAASFHSERLIDLAEEALDSAPGDPVIIRKLEKFLGEFSSAHI